MQGIVYRGQSEVEVNEFPDPEPGPGEVVVRVKASGLCGSDLHHYHGGPRDYIAGHEPAGVIEAVGVGVSPLVAAVGERVLVHHYKGCAACTSCRSGWPQMCTGTEMTLYGTTAHGSHAQLMLAPAESVVHLDDALSFEAGAAIGCGTGTAWRALKRLGEVAGTTIAIFGQGPVGLSASMLAHALGARVIAVDISPQRLEMAMHLGADEAIDATEANAVGAIREVTRGAGVQLTLETSGAVQAGSDAVESLAPWGRACYVGLGQTKAELDVREQVRRQLTVMTSWTMSIVDLHTCAEFAVDRKLPIDEMFTHRWPLDQGAAAYAEFDKQTSGKHVFVF